MPKFEPTVLRPHVQRLLASEASYTHNLAVLVSAYVKPTRARANELGVQPGTLAELFSNTEQCVLNSPTLQLSITRTLDRSLDSMC
jgi:hypothetical protein